MGERVFGFVARWFRRWLGIDSVEDALDDGQESIANLWAVLETMKEDTRIAAGELKEAAKKWDHWRATSVGNRALMSLEKDVMALMDKQLEMQDHITDLARDAGVELKSSPVPSEADGSVPAADKGSLVDPEKRREDAPNPMSGIPFKDMKKDAAKNPGEDAGPKPLPPEITGLDDDAKADPA